MPIDLLPARHRCWVVQGKTPIPRGDRTLEGSLPPRPFEFRPHHAAVYTRRMCPIHCLTGAGESTFRSDNVTKPHSAPQHIGARSFWRPRATGCIYSIIYARGCNIVCIGLRSWARNSIQCLSRSLQFEEVRYAMGEYCRLLSKRHGVGIQREPVSCEAGFGKTPVSIGRERMKALCVTFFLHFFAWGRAV